MPTLFRSSSSFLLLFAAMSCSSPKVWVEAEERFAVPTATVREIRCETANGSIGFEGAPASHPECQVVVRKRGGGADEADAKGALAAIRVTRVETAGKLAIGWEWAPAKQEGWGASVSFSLLAPGNRPLELTTSNGSIAVAGLDAALVVRTSNGPIKLDRCVGDWDAATSNGPIEAAGSPSTLSLKTSNGAVTAKVATKGPVHGKIKTSNGRIDLSLAPDASTRVKAETSNGGVAAEGEWKIHGQGKSHLDASRQGGTGTLVLDTSNGSIRID